VLGGAVENRELWQEFGAVDADTPLPPVPEDLSRTDGDGAMLGRLLVYASIVVVGVAMILWKRVS